MNRYISVNKFVNQLTEHEDLKTFFTLLLMAENPEQKKKIEENFLLDIERLDVQNREFLLESYRQTLPQLLKLSRALRAEVKEFSASLKVA